MLRPHFDTMYGTSGFLSNDHQPCPRSAPLSSLGRAIRHPPSKKRTLHRTYRRIVSFAVVLVTLRPAIARGRDFTSDAKPGLGLGKGGLPHLCPYTILDGYA